MADSPSIIEHRSEAINAMEIQPGFGDVGSDKAAIGTDNGSYSGHGILPSL
jgi:hypothetical protein